MVIVLCHKDRLLVNFTTVKEKHVKVSLQSCNDLFLSAILSLFSNDTSNPST